MRGWGMKKGAQKQGVPKNPDGGPAGKRQPCARGVQARGRRAQAPFRETVTCAPSQKGFEEDVRTVERGGTGHHELLPMGRGLCLRGQSSS